MHMEKINEHQVRCTLTAQDLNARSLSVKDLKYGSSETMDLFRDIVSRVPSEFSFNSEQFPLMIEAVPLPEEALLLIISAVEDSEELDAHFAQFSAAARDVDTEAAGTQDTFYESDRPEHVHVDVCLVRFSSIDEVIAFSKRIGPSFTGDNDLYLSDDHVYYLALMRPDEMNGQEYLAFLNSIMEYGDLVEGSALRYAYLSERSEPVMRDPLGVLSQI